MASPEVISLEVICPKVICLGGATLDRKYRMIAPLQAGTSNPVEGHASFGGVARNVCENLIRLGVRARLATIVGNDSGGRALISQLQSLGAPADLIAQRPDLRTAEYIAALNPDGGLAFGLADMAVFDAFTLDDLDRVWPSLEQAQWVFADCNLPAGVLARLIERRRSSPFKLAIDPVSVAKARKLPDALDGVDLLVLNEDEAAAIVSHHHERKACVLALRHKGVASIMLTHGAAGLHTFEHDNLVYVPAHPAMVRDVTGAGDALIAATIAGLLRGATLNDAARFGATIAALTVESERTVRDDLSPTMLADLARSPS